MRRTDNAVIWLPVLACVSTQPNNACFESQQTNYSVHRLQVIIKWKYFSLVTLGNRFFVSQPKWCQGGSSHTLLPQPRQNWHDRLVPALVCGRNSTTRDVYSHKPANSSVFLFLFRSHFPRKVRSHVFVVPSGLDRRFKFIKRRTGCIHSFFLPPSTSSIQHQMIIVHHLNNSRSQRILWLLVSPLVTLGTRYS